MDDNIRDVLLAVTTVLGTLGGVYVGSALQDRRRHDADKRHAYANFVAGVRETMVVVARNRQADDPGDAEVGDARGVEMFANEALIRMIGSTDVAERAATVGKAFVTWLDIGRSKPSEQVWRAGQENVRVALDEFMQAARKDLS